MESWKIAMLGEGSVGKSCMVSQFVTDSFVATYDPTIEDSYKKQFLVDSRICMLEVIDTAGQEDFATLRNQWVTDCEAFILVYSITSRASFLRIDKYYQEMARAKRGKPKFLLVGNKDDKVDEREVSTEEGYMLARRLATEHFMETSALTRHNIDEAYECVVRMLRAAERPTSEGGSGAAAGGKPPKTKSKIKCVVM